MAGLSKTEQRELWGPRYGNILDVALHQEFDFSSDDRIVIHQAVKEGLIPSGFPCDTGLAQEELKKVHPHKIYWGGLGTYYEDLGRDYIKYILVPMAKAALGWESLTPWK